MEEEKRLEENKKICLRFLKETGLLKAWKDYICCKNSRGIDLNNWYKTHYACRAFGRSGFTSFLRETKNKSVQGNDKITALFRKYAIEWLNGKNIDPYGYRDVCGKHEINKKTNTIKINYKT